MTDPISPHPTDDLAVYALDALDPDDSARVEAHLAGCPTCRDELADHRDTLARLVDDTTDAPPSAVWDTIARATNPEGASGPATDPNGPLDIDATRSIRGRHPRWLFPAAGAAAAASLLILGIVVGRSTAPGPTLAERAADAIEEADEVSTLVTPDGDPAARLVAVDDTAALQFDALGELPADQSYQLWRLDGAEAVSLGVLGDGTRRTVALTLPTEPAELAITTEPAGGTVTATGPIVAQGTFTVDG